MNNAKILAPRRGTKTTMSTAPGKNIVLAAGEIFIENDTTAGVYKIKVGDGSTVYSSLPYGFSGTAEDIKFNAGESGLIATNVEDAIIEAASTGGGSGIFYGTCDTAAATAAKSITVPDGQNFELNVGAMIMVKFSVANTASNVTLNVNTTGAHSIYYDTAVYTGNDTSVTGGINNIVMYVYDGTNWVWAGHSKDSDTTYSVASTSAAGLCPQLPNEQTTTKYLRQDATWVAPTWVGTESEYDLISPKDPNVSYFVTPDPEPEPSNEATE